MPNELTIPAVYAAALSVPPTIGAKGESFARAATTPAASASATTPAPTPQPISAPASTQPAVNPSLRMDTALGIVVIEYRDVAGTVTSSIPSQRQLEAYRLHEQVPPGQFASQPATPPPAAKV